jgi:hypothetical protein
MSLTVIKTKFAETETHTRVKPFALLRAFRADAFGRKEPLATESGIESLSCCHSIIATG